MSQRFELPAYPYDRLKSLHRHAGAHEGGMVDLSVGVPMDPAFAPAVEALAQNSDDSRKYPASIGSELARQACASWSNRSFGTAIDETQVALTIGTKEFVASLPAYLRLLKPDRDTVLFPAISYPSYAMGAELAGLRPVAVAMTDEGCLDLDSVEATDISRALCLWVNTPGNPTGALEDLKAVANWADKHDVTVISDECYIEFTWKQLETSGARNGDTLLNYRTENTLVLHSLSKRSNLAGLRFGFYAGDSSLVHFLSEVRKHAGMMVPGGTQAAGVVALSDDSHVDVQRDIYRSRLKRLAKAFCTLGLKATMPEGAFYLWVRSPSGDGWDLVNFLAENYGIISSPGEFYGHAGSPFVRFAVVSPDDRLELIERRIASQPAIDF